VSCSAVQPPLYRPAHSRSRRGLEFDQSLACYILQSRRYLSRSSTTHLSRASSSHAAVSASAERRFARKPQRCDDDDWDWVSELLLLLYDRQTGGVPTYLGEYSHDQCLGLRRSENTCRTYGDHIQDHLRSPINIGREHTHRYVCDSAITAHYSSRQVEVFGSLYSRGCWIDHLMTPRHQMRNVGLLWSLTGGLVRGRLRLLSGCTQGRGFCEGDLLGIARIPYRLRHAGTLEDRELYSQKEDIVLLNPHEAVHQAT